MKKSILIPVIAFAVLVVFMAGCESQEKAKEEKNKAIISHFYEEMEDKGNLDVVEDIIATNCVFHFPGGVNVRGPEGYKEYIAPIYTALPDLKHVIEDMIAEGDKVVARFTVRGTYRGEFMGIAPTGKQVVCTSMAVYSIVKGKFMEVWCDYDALGLMQQFGVIPPMGQGEE